MDKNKKIKIMSEAPIPEALLKMGLPTMIGMLITALYTLADTYFVGRLGTAQVAAVSVTYPIVQVMIGMGMMFGSGASSFLARLLGAKNDEKADQVASVALYTSVILGILFSAAVLIFTEPIMRALGATDTIMPHALAYGKVYILFAIFNIFNVTMNNIITSEGATKLTMFAMMLGAGLNVVFDPIFIYVFNMGVAGAAWATIFSQLITTLLYVGYILSKKSVFTFSIKKFSPDKEIYIEVLKVGVPTLVFQLLTSIAISLTNTIAALYGDEAIAAIGIVTRIMTLGTYAVFGFSKGFQPLAGYNYGAGSIGRLMETIKRTLSWTSVFCVVMATLFVIAPSYIMSIFTRESAVIEMGSKALRANGITFIFFGYFVVYSTLYLALGKAKQGSLLSISRQGYFFIPIILILPSAIGIKGVLYAQAIADVFSIILTFVMSFGIKRELSQINRDREKVTA